MIGTVKNIIKNDNFKKTLTYVIDALFSGIIGCLLGLFLQDPKFIIFGMVVLVVFIVLMTIITTKADQTFNLLKILKEDKKKGKWNEIIRIVYPLSRPLFLSRNYRLRVEMGKLVNEACQNLAGKTIMINNKLIPVSSIQASTLIDDLGWTLYKLKNNNETAKENINLGITIAKNNKDYEKIIKGYRHLMGIASETHESITTIYEYRDLMIQYFSSPEYKNAVSQETYELTDAGIHYSVARILTRLAATETNPAQKKSLLSDATKEIELAVKIYEKRDNDRYAKTFNVRADILMQNNDIDELAMARHILEQGLAYCKNLQRNDNYIRISLKLLAVEDKRLSAHKFTKEEKANILRTANTIYANVMKELTSDDYDEDFIKQADDLKKAISDKCRN